MKNWYKQNLGDGILAAAECDEIRELYQKMTAKGKMPASAAIFLHHNNEGRLHCEVTAFFSPDAEEIARNLNAAPCVKPAAKGLTLLAGNSDSMKLLFPAES